VYKNVTTLDGTFSIPYFKALYARAFLDGHAATAEYHDAVRQFSNLFERCVVPSGLVAHGYDPTRTFPIWGDLNPRGHSQSIWGRAVGWATTGMLLLLDIIPAHDPEAARLRHMFEELMAAVYRAQDKSGAWWQVVDKPGQGKNFEESSFTGLAAYAMLRGVRQKYLGHSGTISASNYVHSATRAYRWLRRNAVVSDGKNTLGYNLTVDVCSINSTTAFEVRATFSLYAGFVVLS
jgi:rhamnogalacturonyl hydrolase YesR